MNSKLKELKQIVRFCKQNGVFRLKTGAIEIELGGSPVKKKIGIQPGQDAAGPPAPVMPAWEDYTPEQRLLWSSTPIEANG